MPKLYEMRIELDEVSPPVWRTILISDDEPLINLHATIQGAMGWNCSHMFAFETMDDRFELQFGDGLNAEGSREVVGVILRDIFVAGSKASYQYDFGDDWWHTLTVLDHRPVAKGDKPPRCMNGERACPPDDCGGPPGFEELLAAAADPKHPDHDELAEWLGDYDPSRFDIKIANREIRKLVKLHADMAAGRGRE